MAQNVRDTIRALRTAAQAYRAKGDECKDATERKKWHRQAEYVDLVADSPGLLKRAVVPYKR